MSIIKTLIEGSIRWAKSDSSYSVPEGMPSGMLFLEFLKRTVMALRGIFLWLFLQEGRGMIFLGKRVRVRAPKYLRLGRSVSIHDNVYLDALSRQGVTLGDNVTIRENTILECTGVLQYPGEGIIIGNNVGISQNCFIAARGFIRIGNDVQIGPSVILFSENHNYENPNVLIRYQGVRRKGIVVEDDCWLGAGSKILDGVVVGKGSVIAAGSVVTLDVPPYSVVAGVPARLIKKT